MLSIEPRVFEVHNLFTKEESDKVIEHMLAETDENMRLKRSYLLGYGRRNQNKTMKRTKTRRMTLIL